MLKTKKSRHEDQSDPELDISSLIDVSFLLLIFFIVTTTLVKQELDLGMELPPLAKVNSDPPDALEIAIAGDGSITIGGQVIAGPSENGEASQIEEVRFQLEEHKRRATIFKEEPLVSLKASGEANTQRFIDVINALAYAGIENIALQDDFSAN